MSLIKVCGLTREADGALAASLGVDFIGLNFWPRSKRFVEPERGAAVAAAARAVRPQIQVVGVFVNPTADEVTRADVHCELDLLQLHGDENPHQVRGFGERAFKGVAVRDRKSVEVALGFPGPWILLDTPTAGYGGSGAVFDWTLVAGLKQSKRSWFLAGGLNPTNVAAAILSARPTAVDVASGVESEPGIKDEAAMRAFVEAAKDAFAKADSA